MADRDLASEVGELKGRVDSLATIANKLDVIIERLVDIHDRHITKVYDDMEKRRMETILFIYFGKGIFTERVQM